MFCVFPIAPAARIWRQYSGKLCPGAGPEPIPPIQLEGLSQQRRASLAAKSQDAESTCGFPVGCAAGFALLLLLLDGEGLFAEGLFAAVDVPPGSALVFITFGGSSTLHSLKF